VWNLWDIGPGKADEMAETIKIQIHAKFPHQKANFHSTSLEHYERPCIRCAILINVEWS
jgi:hypothetical protein